MKKTILTLMMIAAIFISNRSLAQAQCTVDAGPNISFCCGGQTDTLRGHFWDTLCPCTNKLYQWTPTVGLSNPNSLTTAVTPTGTTVYTLCATAFQKNQFGACKVVCCQACDQVTVSVNNSCCRITGIQAASLSSGIKVYPSPAKNLLVVEIANLKSDQIQMYDINGKLILRETTNDKQSRYEMNVGNLSRGIYILKIMEGERELSKQKVILE